MIVKIKHSGGFAGKEEDLGTINTDNLDREAAEHVENQVAHITKLLEEAEGYPPVGTDMYQYEIELTGAEQMPQKLVIVDEGDENSPFMKAVNDLRGFLQASH